jgi:hypothetical protein
MRQKEMRDAARAAEMTEEEVALEKLKVFAERGAARKAATRQAWKDKRAAEEAKHRAAMWQAGKDRHAAGEATRKATTGQAGKAKRVSEEAARKAATGQAGKAKRESVETARKAATGQEGKNTRAAGDATRWAKKKAEAATALEKAAAKQNQSKQVQRELHVNLARKTHETLGAAECAAEASKSTIFTSPG